MQRHQRDRPALQLQMELEAGDGPELGAYTVAQMMRAIDLWLGMLPSAVVRRDHQRLFYL